MSGADNVIPFRPKVARRLSVALIAESSDALDESAEREGLSPVDVVNRAVQLYNEFGRVTADGGVIMVKAANGKVQKWTVS